MTTELLQKRLSANMKAARKKKRFSQEKLAEVSCLSSQMINDIEGCRRWPSEKTLIKIINALEIDTYSLFLPEPAELREEENERKDMKREIVSQIRSAVECVLSKIETE